MKLFLSLEDNIMISMVQEIIQSVDVNGIVSPFALMNKRFLIIRIPVDICIGTINRENMVAVHGNIGKGCAFLYERMKQEIPSLRQDFLSLLDESG